MPQLLHRCVDGKIYKYSATVQEAYTGYWGYLADLIKLCLGGDYERKIVHWGVGEGTVPCVVADYGFENQYGVDPRSWGADVPCHRLSKEQAIALPDAFHVFDAYKGYEEQEVETQELFKEWGIPYIAHKVVRQDGRMWAEFHVVEKGVSRVEWKSPRTFPDPDC